MANAARYELIGNQELICIYDSYTEALAAGQRMLAKGYIEYFRIMTVYP